MRSFKEGSYLGSPVTRQQSPSSLQTTAAEAEPAVMAKTAAPKTALLRAFISNLHFYFESWAKRCEHRNCSKEMTLPRTIILGVMNVGSCEYPFTALKRMIYPGNEYIRRDAGSDQKSTEAQ
jgi:hypothetical protein